ncbi:hypothetical protein TIFTF001_026725 [Ficus carica]|uniref:WLM domain-containing protein n=1 Tax=Ficus carica TaxID=3494 RepID=A0AA88DLM2_FICCA|nr:hypothetical protein TIFTF001_026725 [Ficus carica]
MNSFKDPHKVWKITTLKKINQEEAKQILHKVAKLVQPIMAKHKWRVMLLAEYHPRNPAIQGENVREILEIKLRLRRPNSDIDFFPIVQILDNMLHQLCHYAHSNHDDDFYDLLDRVRKECNEMLVKGQGDKLELPGRFNSRLPALFTFIPSGPKHLGGNSTAMKSLRPREAAAMAAERRLRIDLWCGTKYVSDSSVQSAPNASSQLLLDRSKLVLKVLVWVLFYKLIWEFYKYLFL